jgi:TRAP-type C4-dicarboxylate transport system substrate-binding protein
MATITACGVTHAPGCMLVTDLRNSQMAALSFLHNEPERAAPATQPENDAMATFKMPRFGHLTIAAVVTATLATAGPGFAQTKRDMPTPYSDGTFQTVNVRQFVADVKTALGGKLDITVHSNASLVKMPEMRRAVATGQVQLGELLISVLSN